MHGMAMAEEKVAWR